jgi:hypothetical protein
MACWSFAATVSASRQAPDDDSTPPAVASIRRESPATTDTSAAGIVFAVRFSEPVRGIDNVGPVFDNFAVATTAGDQAGTVSAVSADSGSSITVTVATAAGRDGVLRLDLVATGSIRSAADVPLAGPHTGDEVFHVDRRPPRLQAIVPAYTDPTNADSMNFTARFDEAITDFGDPGDVVVNHSGTTHATVTITTQSASRYTVTVGGIGGTGSFTLSVPASVARDRVGNLNLAGGPGAAAHIDNTPPQTTAAALPAFIRAASFNIAWTGTDLGSRIVYVNLFYRRGGAGSFMQYGGGYTTSPIVFDTRATGEAGSYEFYTLGADLAGNFEPAPAVADAQTFVSYEPRPAIACAPSSFALTCLAGSAGATATLLVRNSAAGTLRYAIASNATWCTVSPTTGVSTAGPISHAVQIRPTGLQAGDYVCTLTVSGDPDVPPLAVPVRLRVTARQLTTRAEPAIGGRVDPRGTTQYPDNTRVTLRATPSHGWLFTRWSGATTATANPTEIVMNGDKSVTANFARIQQPNLGGAIDTVSPRQVIVGRPITVSGRVFNDGPRPTTRSITIELRAVGQSNRYSGLLCDPITIPNGLAADSAWNLPTSPTGIVRTDVPYGWYKVELRVDTGNAVDEFDEADNTAAWSPLQVRPDLPNLTIEGFDFDPQVVTSATMLSFAGLIRNDGSRPTSGPFHLELRVWPAPGFKPTGALLCEGYDVTGALNPGDTFDLATLPPHRVNPLSPAVYCVGLLVDTTHAVAEQTDNDNTAFRILKYLYAGGRPLAAPKWMLYR